MDAHGSGEPLTDIDRELAALLAVEPSPEFVARVRMRIAAEPQPAGWIMSRMALGVAMVAAVATIAVGVAQIRIAAPPAGPPQGTAALAMLTHSTNEKPPDEMRRVMSSNAEMRTACEAHVKSGDYDAIRRAAQTYAANFSFLERFWMSRNAGAAVRISTVGQKAAADLEAAAFAHDASGVAAAIAAIFGTCEACHKQYREQLSDGTFAIKL